ncbi:MAG TPA: helix-turn-helix domain-containing protein [Caulobacteraceae bacterium]|jgi:AcrR family transcriptional regulator|nr:helix-turn-helix domain-containing protein [Caulobacteraceae bacterium]
MESSTTLEAPVSARRRPKGDKRARTRAALIEAARQIIREQGYEALTLASVAERAGMTTGAIYGNFRNRTDLLMGVAEVSGAPIMARTWPGMSFRELMHETAAAVIEALPQRREAMVGTLGFHIQTLTHQDLRERSLAKTKDIYHRIASMTPLLIPSDRLPMPAEMLVPVMHALMDGLVLHRVLTPELVPDEVIYAAFDALAAGAPG